MTSPLLCWNCGKDLVSVPRPISRHDHCPDCFEVLHCCRLCKFYQPGRPGDCDHERAEPPVIKESANFCSYFSPSFDAYKGQDRTATNNAAKDQLNSLFGDEDISADDTSSRKKDEQDDLLAAKPKPISNPLDDLFDD